MPKTDNGFEWPAVYESTVCALVASRLFEPFLEERRARNREIWSEPRNWRLGFYFGKGDTRLWVPRKPKNGLYQDQARIINFSHPMRRKAFRILATGYGIGFIAIVMTVAALSGIRW